MGKEFDDEVKAGRENRKSWVSKVFGIGGVDESKAQEPSSDRDTQDARTLRERMNDTRGGSSLNLDKDKTAEFVKSFRRGK